MKEYLTEKQTEELRDKITDWEVEGLNSKIFHQIINDAIDYYLNCESYQKELEKILLGDNIK